MSLRLQSGDLRGRRIEVAEGIRPTESRVREALFSIWRDQVPGCGFLDLFAGTGAVGLEALGLGAGRVCFVDHAPKVLATLRKNVQRVGTGGEIVRGRLPEVLKRRLRGDFDLIFADPPYDFDRYRDLIEAAAHRALPGARIAVEHSTRVSIDEEVVGWCRRDQRRYGESCISFFETADRG